MARKKTAEAEAIAASQAIASTPGIAPPEAPTEASTPEGAPPASTTSEKKLKDNNFLRQIIEASGMSLDEIAVAYGRHEEGKNLPEAEIKSKWKPKLQNYLRNPDKLKISGFQQLMKIVGAEIVLKYSTVTRSEISVR